MIQADITELNHLISVKQGRVDSLLELTKAVNSNFSRGALMKLFEFILVDRFKVGKFALFVNESGWKTEINIGNTDVADTINVEEDLLKFGVIQDVRKYPTDLFKGFDFIIPVVSKKIHLAYLLVGEIRLGRLESIDQNLKFLETIASFIIVSLENKRLFQTQLEQERIGKELELASQVQNMLIPSKLPKNESMDVAAYYKPYAGIGGDYYDVISVDENTTAFCVCDVSGKGLSGGMLMANFQAQLRSLVNKYDSLEQLVDFLNYKMFEITGGDRYITMFLAIYDSSSRQLKYVSAGHNPTILIQNGELYKLDEGCTIIGAFETLPQISSGQIFIEQNAIAMCYTDGLTELENELGEQYGFDQLCEFVFKHIERDVDDIMDTLKTEMDTFRGAKEFNDDVCILLNRFF